LSQSFALFMSPGISLKPGSENAHRVKELLAHELLHNWTGGWITVDQPERLLYWFTEGFTNHYTRRLLYRAGQITLDEYLGFLNELTVGYMHSPVRDQPNEIIEKDFWSRGEVHELPYLRGDMLAIEVDWEIRRASHGKKSLDDFMRAALAQARALKRPLDNQALLELIGSFTSSEFVGRIQKQIWQGELVVLPATAYAPCLLLQTHPVGPFDIGFDFERGRASKVVSGVKRNSNAFASGLRDGQKLLGWEVHDQQPLKPARLTVMDGARRLDLSYLPQGPPIQVPLFSKQPAAEKTCRGIL
jgi:predicted metalloprotease with PDZ domain